MRIRAAARILVATLILLAPAALNRSPFLFFDTEHYLQFGRSIATRLPLLDRLGGHLAGAAAPHTSEDRPHPSLSYSGGRSPTYGLFAYLSVRLAGLWGVAVVQAALAAWVLWTIFQVASPGGRYLVFVALLAALTPLSFFVDMVMPDVFAGLALATTLTLVLAFDRLNRRSRIGLVLVTAAAISTHTTIGPLCLVALLAVAATLGRGRLRRWPVLLWGASPVALAGLAALGFSLATQLVLGAAPRNPPFLMARVLADGPGRQYLRHACHPVAQFALCRFEDYRFRSQDDFLWSGEPGIGVFSAVDYATRTRLQDEELNFVTETIAAYPLEQLQAAATHWLDQLASFAVSPDFGRARQSWDSMSLGDTIPEQAANYQAGLAYRQLFPFAAFDLAQGVTAIAALAWLLVRLGGTKRGPLWRAAIVAILATLVVNAALCGMLSGVNDRYQARIVWLLPAAALLLINAEAAATTRSTPRSSIRLS